MAVGGRMNSKVIAGALAGKIGVTKIEALRLTGAVLEVLVEELAAGGDVKIHGFGTFSTVDRPARQTRNPKTGAPLVTPAKRAARFKVGGQLKARLAEQP